MKIEELFEQYRIQLLEDGKPRKLSDVIEDIYLILGPDEYKMLRSQISKAESDENIFENFRKSYEE